jgi:hypothetical protein
MRTQKRRVRLPSPATTLAILALLAATAGSATAAAERLITGRQIKNGSVTGADIKNKSLTASDIRGAIRGARGAPGREGPPGPAGAQGAQGPKGDPGSVGPITAVEAVSQPIPPQDVGGAAAACPAGQTAISGGFDLTEGATIVLIDRAVAANVWFVGGINVSSTDTATVKAYAYCAAVPRANAANAAVDRNYVERLTKKLRLAHRR